MDIRKEIRKSDSEYLKERRKNSVWRRSTDHDCREEECDSDEHEQI